MIDLVAEAIMKADNTVPPAWLSLSEDMRDDYRCMARAAIAAFRPTITTVEQLDALPDFSVIFDRCQTVWEKEDHCGKGVPWSKVCNEGEYTADAIPLPATVLYTPEGQE